MLLSEGQMSDYKGAALMAPALPKAKQPLADKGYDADAYIAGLRARAIKPVIPPKANRKNKRDCDYALYRERNLVERFFQFIKHFRRHRHTLRENRAQFLRRLATNLRDRLA